MIGGISFSATSITSGLDADKHANPAPGNQYLATDTKKQYNCYVAGVWVNAVPPLPKIAIVETAINPDSTSTQIFYKGLSSANLTNRPNDCSQTPNYAFIIQTDFTAFLQFFTRGYDGTGGGTTYHRMCINGVSAYLYTSNHRNGVANTLIHEFKKGDFVKVIATSTANDSGIQAQLAIKCIPSLNIDGVKFVPTSIDQSAFLLMVP
jgi:hypothetical protein